MKRIAFLVLVFFPKWAFSAPPVAEAQIKGVSDGTTVSVSNASWTPVPTTVSLTSRSGLKISNPSTNAANIVCIMDTTTPSEATTIRPIEIQPGENPFIPVRYDILLYCLSLDSGSMNVHVQEVSQ